MRRGDRHVWRRAGAAAIGVMLLAGARSPFERSRRAATARMQVAADAADAAVRAARDAEDAMRWAPDELAAAERASRDALTRQRVEQVRALADTRRRRRWLTPGPPPSARPHAAAELARSRHAAGASSATEQIDRGRQAAVRPARRRRRRSTSGPTDGCWPRREPCSTRLAPTSAPATSRPRRRARGTRRPWPRQATARAVALAARYADAETIARWQRWKSETIAWSRREGRAAIVVVKDAHLMTLFVRGEPVKTYTVELGFNWIADKRPGRRRLDARGPLPRASRMDHLASELLQGAAHRLSQRRGSRGVRPRAPAAASSRRRPGSADSSRSTAEAAASATGPTAAWP